MVGVEKKVFGDSKNHGWLMKGRMRERKPPLPGPLLHKCVEERENTPELSLHEPA
jgi:hypothetical protein